MRRVLATIVFTLLVAGAVAAVGGALAATPPVPPPTVYTGEADAYPDHLLGYATLPAVDLYAPHAKGTIATVGGQPYSDAVAAVADTGFLVTSIVQGGVPDAGCDPDAPPCVNQVPTYVNSVYPTGPGLKSGCLAPHDRGQLCEGTRLGAAGVEVLRSLADANCSRCPSDPRPTSRAEVGVSGYEVPGQLKVGAQFASQRQYIDDDGLLRVRAESTVKDVLIGGVLRIGSLTAMSEARGAADDRTKKAASRVSMSGVTLGGQVLDYDERGFRVAGGPAAVDPESARAQARALFDQLAASGIEIDIGAPATASTKKPGKVESAATALTIHFRPAFVPQSLTQDYVLGYARAAVTASDVLAPEQQRAVVPIPGLGAPPLVSSAAPASAAPAEASLRLPLGQSGVAVPRRIVRGVRPSAFVADTRSLASLMWVFAAAGLVTPVAALALKRSRRRQRGEWAR